jgi:hypothetical protein
VNKQLLPALQAPDREREPSSDRRHLGRPFRFSIHGANLVVLQLMTGDLGLEPERGSLPAFPV